MAALEAAATVLSGQQPPADAPAVTALANQLLAWVTRARLNLTVSPITYRQGSVPGPEPTRYTDGGNVQLTDTQQVTLTVQPEDSKGFPTSDTLTWSSADDTVVSLQPSADTLSCLVVAGNPGLGVVVTVTDGTISATDSFDVVPGGVATLQISEGTPEEQPPPAGP